MTPMTFPWWPALLVLALAVAYGVGLSRLWRRAGTGVAVTWWQGLAFVAGLAGLLVAFASPLVWMEHSSLAAFTTRHLLLLSLLPALLLAGRPGAVLAHVVPARLSARLHQRTARMQGILVEGLWVATAAHIVVLVVWQLPSMVDAALQDGAIHGAVHLSLLLAGFWFWAAVQHRMRSPTERNRPAIIAVGATAITLALLGMLLALGELGLHALHAIRSPQLGLDAGDDRTLAGLAMRAFALVPYLTSLFWLLRRRGRVGS